MSDTFVKGRWKEQETIQLTKLIKQQLRADPNTHIVDIGKMVEAEGIVIPWSTISKKMGNRSRLSCFKKFQKMTGLFSPSDSNGTRIKQQRSPAPALPPLQLQGPHVPVQGQPNHSTDDDDDDDDDDDNTAALIGDIGGVVLPTTRAAHASVVGLERDDIQDVVGQDHVEPTNAGADLDMFLLSELASSGANRTSEVDWGTLRVDEGQERWNDLVMEWQQQEGEEATEDALMTLSFYELAQLLLDRKASAKMAAETVEAVDLPTV